MANKIEIPNLENGKLLKFLIAEGVDMPEKSEVNIDGLETSGDSLIFMSSDKARMFVTKSQINAGSISDFSGNQLSECLKILGKDAVVKFTKDKEFPVFVVDEDKQNVIVLAPRAKE